MDFSSVSSSGAGAACCKRHLRRGERHNIGHFGQNGGRPARFADISQRHFYRLIRRSLCRRRHRPKNPYEINLIRLHGPSLVVAQPSYDTFVQLNGSDGFVNGNDLNDSISGKLGRDTLIGGEDEDLLRGEGGVDTIMGGEGDDILDGGASGDSLFWPGRGGYDQRRKW